MTTTVTSVSSTTSSALLIAADGSRSSLVIENTDGGRLYCLLVDDTGTATTVSGGFTFSLVENGTATLTPPECQQAVYGIWASDGSGGATITAITDPVTDSNSAIQTYAELKTAVQNWLRPNVSSVTADMTARIPQYIGLAEVRIRRELRLRALDQASASLAIAAGLSTVPTGFQSVLSFVNTASPYEEINYMPIDGIEKLDPTATGNPLYYDRTGSQFVTWPPSTVTARLRFRRGVTPLTADDDTNWLLQGHPDVYLYGALIHADRRLIGTRLGEWKEGFAEAMNGIQGIERQLHTGALRPLPSQPAV